MGGGTRQGGSGGRQRLAREGGLSIGDARAHRPEGAQGPFGPSTSFAPRPDDAWTTRMWHSRSR